MKLWECTYVLTSDYSKDRWIDYVWSTSPVTIETAIHHWNVIFPGGYTVSEFTCTPAPAGMTEETARPHIIERIGING